MMLWDRGREREEDEGEERDSEQGRGKKRDRVIFLYLTLQITLEGREGLCSLILPIGKVWTPSLLLMGAGNTIMDETDRVLPPRGSQSSVEGGHWATIYSNESCE